MQGERRLREKKTRSDRPDGKVSQKNNFNGKLEREKCFRKEGGVDKKYPIITELGHNPPGGKKTTSCYT